MKNHPLSSARFERSARASVVDDAERRQPMVGHQGTRFAPLSASTYSAESRTVEAVLSSGAPVQRCYYTEELEISAEAIDLTRATSGLVPLLNAHNRFEIGAVLGTISNVRVKGGQLLGTLKFAETEPGRAAEGMVARGELRGVSIGYNVLRWEITRAASPEAGEPETWRATRWELLEASLVPVPADANTGVRSIEAVVPGNSDEDQDMFTRNNPAGRGSPAGPAAPPIALSMSAPGDSLRPASISDLRTAADYLTNFGVSRAEVAELTLDMASRQLGYAAASELVMSIAADRQRQDTGRIRGGPSIEDQLRGGGATYDNPAFHGRAVSDAIYARMSGHAPAEQSRQFMGLTLIQLASECLSRSGNREVSRMSPEQVLSAAMTRSFVAGAPSMTTSDFPGLLTAAGNRYLLEIFAIAGSAVKRVSRLRTGVTDFREISGLQLSAGGRLPEIPENGEFQNTHFQERKESYRIVTFGRTFNLSRQAIINDDLGAFANANQIMARMAAETEAAEFADLLNSNPVLSDGKPLFHADHGNLADAGGAPTVATLGAGRLALRTQKDADGVTPFPSVPRTILVGAERETQIEQLLVATTVPTASVDANPFQGKLTLEVDPRLNAAPWYLFADTALAPVIEYAYLGGHAGPHMEMNEHWTSLGQSFRVYMDFGAGIVDHRGAYKNPGA